MKKILSLIKRKKSAVIAAAAILALLCIAFFTAPGLSSNDKIQPQIEATQSTESPKDSNTVSETKADDQPSSEKAQGKSDDNTTETVKATEPASVKATASTVSESTKKQNSDSEKKKDKYQTEETPQGKPKPVEPQEQEIEDEVLTCKLSVSCASILNNKDELDPSKKEIIPADGWILKPVSVKLNKGESVFDVLQRVCREKNIHLEYSLTPVYNSAYIEGIGNIYEFDCGPLSGWMYKVNDWFPNYGFSRYEVKDGDDISILYTCNMGYDIGGSNASGE